MTPSGRRARRFATFGSLYCLCLTRWQQHSTCCMPRVLLVCVRGRAVVRSCVLLRRYAVFSVGVSGAARHRNGHTLIASPARRGRPASKKTADARLICIPIIIRVGRASRSSSVAAFRRCRPSSPWRRCRCSALPSGMRPALAVDIAGRARCTSCTCTPDIWSCRRGADNDMLRCARGVYVHVHTRSRARARSAREASGVRTPHSCADDGCCTRHTLHTLHATWRFFQSCNPCRRPGARTASSGRLLFASGDFLLKVRATARTRTHRMHTC